MKAIWSPHTGIVDWALVTEHYGKNFRDLGGSIYLDFEVKDFNLVEDDTESYPVRVVSDGKVSAFYKLMCHSDCMNSWISVWLMGLVS